MNAFLWVGGVCTVCNLDLIYRTINTLTTFHKARSLGALFTQIIVA